MNASTHDRPPSSSAADAAPDAAPDADADAALEGGEGSASNTRRQTLRRLGKMGLGAAALSFATFGPGVRKAVAQDGDPVSILNFALTLEYLESVYYQTAVDTDGLLPDGQARDVYELVATHEEKHVGVLRAAISAAGGTPVGPFDESNFDFTAGGTFPNPFDNYTVFLALSQAFEDTGVRAYKGQAANIPGDLDIDVPDVGTFNALTTALQIHSVEARHAAEARRLRAARGDADVQPWILLDNPGLGQFNDAVQPVYAGEDQVTQAGVNLADQLNYDEGPISEAFDEPLSMSDVNAIAGLFIEDDDSEN